MRIERSDSIDPEAIMFCCGCVCIYPRISVADNVYAHKATTHRNGDDDVGVALKCLHDLPALEVPQVHLVVLAAGDDPLAARHAEARRDAVLLVRVPDVRLETARRLPVPQPDRAVVRGGEDVFGVWRELDVLAVDMGA